MSYSDARQRYEKAVRAFAEGDMTTVKKLAAEATEQLGKEYISAEPLFKRIEKEWLEKGLSLGAIIKTSNGYMPKAEEIETEEIIEYRGRNPVTKKNKSLDISRFVTFCIEYEAYKKNKEI